MIETVCSGVSTLTGSTSEVLLFRLDRGMPITLEWPYRISKTDHEFPKYCTAVAPILPLGSEGLSRPLGWQSPPAAGPTRAQECSAVQNCAGIELIDRNRDFRYLMVLARSVGSPPFGRQEGTLLQVLSLLISRLLSLRSKADDRARELLFRKELEDGAAILSPREAQIAELLCGRTRMAAVAEQLHISPRTVERHALHIYRKLRVANREQLIREIAGEPM